MWLLVGPTMELLLLKIWRLLCVTVIISRRIRLTHGQIMEWQGRIHLSTPHEAGKKMIFVVKRYRISTQDPIRLLAPQELKISELCRPVIRWYCLYEETPINSSTRHTKKIVHRALLSTNPSLTTKRWVATAKATNFQKAQPERVAII